MPGHRRNRVSQPSSRTIRSTTILGVRRDGIVAMAGDGQVTVGDVVLKHGARKIRTLYDGAVIAGFAGAVADALTLFAKFEIATEGVGRQPAQGLRRAGQRMANRPLFAPARSPAHRRRWRIAPGLSGEGDVIEPDDGIAAIGSGAPYATAAAKALVAHTDLARAGDRRVGDGDRR